MAMIPKALIVEDEAIFCLLLEFIFKQRYQIVRAGNGLEAWRRLHNEPFDLLVTDFHMPHIGGMELCKLIRKDARLHCLPIILVTAKAFEIDCESIEQEIRHCRVFIKPFHRQRLLEAAKELVNASYIQRNDTAELGAETSLPQLLT